MDIAWIQSYYSDYRWRSSSHVPETGAGVVAPYSSGGSFCMSHLASAHGRFSNLLLYSICGYLPPARKPARARPPAAATSRRNGRHSDRVFGLRIYSECAPMIVNLSEFRSFHEQEAVRFRLLRATAGLWWIKAWLSSQAKTHELLSLRKRGGVSKAL